MDLLGVQLSSSSSRISERRPGMANTLFQSGRPINATSARAINEEAFDLLCSGGSGRGQLEQTLAHNKRLVRTFKISAIAAAFFLYHCLLGWFHQGQGDEDTDKCQPTGDVKGVDIAAEHVLCLTCYEPSGNGANSIG